MKQLGLLPILLLLGVGITSGLAAAELTASQNVPPVASVGETVTVTVMLTYNGVNATQVVVTPGLPMGVVTDMPGGQATDLYPGAPAPISYPIRAVQSGTYTIISQIAYAEDGTWRELRLEAPFTAEGETSPPLTPNDVSASTIGSGMPPVEAPPGEAPPVGAPPLKPLPGEIVSPPPGPGEISNVTPNEALDGTMDGSMPSRMPEMPAGIDSAQRGPARQ